MDDPTKFTLFAELKAHAVPWQNRRVRPAIATCYLASVSIKPSTVLTSWGKSSCKWLSRGGRKERAVTESHTMCLFIYQFHSNFKELGISPPHLKILYFQLFLLKCRAEFLSRKTWQRTAALHQKVTKSPGLAEVGLSAWFLQELLWTHLPMPSAAGGIPGTEEWHPSSQSIPNLGFRAAPLTLVWGSCCVCASGA